MCAVAPVAEATRARKTERIGASISIAYEGGERRLANGAEARKEVELVRAGPTWRSSRSVRSSI